MRILVTGHRGSLGDELLRERIMAERDRHYPEFQPVEVLAR
jgi:dTDP-4-dehydrorhamnose reductase